MPNVKVNNYNIHYEDDNFSDPWTEPEVVLIQHGVGRSSTFWNRWVPHLSGDYRVIRRDLIGFGQSSDPGDLYDWTLDGQVREMVSFLDVLNINKVHYIGESFGGVIGLALAATHPERLSSLTICSTPIESITNLANFTPDEMLKASKTDSQADSDQIMENRTRQRIEERVLVPTSLAHEDWIISECNKNRVHVMRALRDLTSNFDVREMLSGVDTPTLVLAPSRSPITTFQHQEEIAARLPNATLERVDGRGHEIFVEKHVQCIDAFKAFITKDKAVT